jgi:hypothetical protein
MFTLDSFDKSTPTMDVDPDGAPSSAMDVDSDGPTSDHVLQSMSHPSFPEMSTSVDPSHPPPLNRSSSRSSPYPSPKDCLPDATPLTSSAGQDNQLSGSGRQLRDSHRQEDRGARKRGGIRKALHQMFGKPFWDIATNITLEEFDSLPAEYRKYIITKRAEDKAKRSGGDDQDNLKMR